MEKETRIIGVIGLGYVGLPVATEFAKRFRTIGFDVNERRIDQLQKGIDKNGEILEQDLKHPQLHLTTSLEELRKANFFIVAVPTPIDEAKQPDLSPLKGASEIVGKALKAGDIVVYESTVYPGVTEDYCLPILETVSGLKGGADFKIGYSPERINPGDGSHTFALIKKVVSGQDEATLGEVARVYGTVVTAGVFRAATIKVAEAAKVIENTQRDLNIALMNELAIIFDKMEIDTQAVLEAAGTKWNFLPFKPGLVGGHCIGVDPYYLTHQAEKFQYHPQVILAGRRINDGMGTFIAQKTVKELLRAGHGIVQSRVTVLGLSFKENCKDIRNTRVIDIIQELRDYGVEVQVYDPFASAEEAHHEYGVHLLPWEELAPAHAVVCAVAHEPFLAFGATELKKLMQENPVLIDVKGIYPAEKLRAEGIRVWRL